MIKKWRRIQALVVKESYQIIRDPSCIIIAFVLPLILLFIYGFGISLDFTNLKIGLVIEDLDPEVLSLADSFKFSRYFDAHIGRHQREFIPELESGKIHGIVVVPFYFSSFRQRPDHQAPIFVIADGSDPNTANFVQNYVMGAWNNWQDQDAISNGTHLPVPARIQQRYWYNEELDSRHFLVPGSIAIIMTLIGTLLTALVLAREWERGTMEALMSTPITIGEILVGKLIPYFCLGMASMTLCTLVACFLYGLPLRGSFAVLALVSAVFLFAALGLGLLISSFARNQFVASQTATISSFLPAFMLSGFVFEITSMPEVIQLITHVVPARYFVSSLQAIFLVGNVWELLWPNILAMAGFAAIMFFIISQKAVKRLD